MKISKIIMPLAVTLVMSSLSAFAQDKDGGVGNGGVSVVCRGEDNKITSAQLLDIYEGEIRFKKVYDYEASEETLLNLAVARLEKYAAYYRNRSLIKEELRKVQDNFLFVPEGHELLPTNDALPVLKKEGCKFEQLANYTIEGDVLVDQEIYEALPEIDKAALLIHESVYAIARLAGAKDSRLSRRITAEVMAKNFDEASVEKVVEGMNPIPKMSGTQNGASVGASPIYGDSSRNAVFVVVGADPKNKTKFSSANAQCRQTAHGTVSCSIVGNYSHDANFAIVSIGFDPGSKSGYIKLQNGSYYSMAQE